MSNLGMGIGVGSSILGGVLSSLAARRAQDEMASQFAAEQARQQGFANEAQGKWVGSLADMTAQNAMGQVDNGRQQRLAEFANVAQAKLSPQNIPMTGVDSAFLRTSTGARAKLGGYSDWAIHRMIQDIKTQQELNKVVNFAQGQAGVFPLSMYKAQHSGDFMDLLGQIISSLGGTGGAFTSLLANEGRSSKAPTYASMGNTPYGPN